MNLENPFLWIEVNQSPHLHGAETLFNFVPQILEKMKGCTIYNEPALNYIGLKVKAKNLDEAKNFDLPLFAVASQRECVPNKQIKEADLVGITDWLDDFTRTFLATADLSQTVALMPEVGYLAKPKSMAIVAKETKFDFILIPGKKSYDYRGVPIGKIATRIVPSWYFDEEKHTEGVTAKTAIENGFNMVVVGDWITKNIDPVAVLTNVLGDMFGSDFKRDDQI